VLFLLEAVVFVATEDEITTELDVVKPEVCNRENFSGDILGLRIALKVEDVDTEAQINTISHKEIIL
jgi:hypothetical protein